MKAVIEGKPGGLNFIKNRTSGDIKLREGVEYHSEGVISFFD